MARFFRYYALIISALLFHGCANMQPPGGGEVDITPPAVSEVNPPNRMTNFSGNEIELTFSEYVDKRTFKDAIFISPALEKGFDVSWSGKTATITLKEELKQDVTYNLTIGTSVVDLNNSNNMAEAYSYIFSTGDRIDQGVITGKIYDKDPNKLYIFAYLTGDDDDSLLKRKPDFVTQTGPSGEFILSGLPKGKFRVFAVGNSFGDLVYNLNSDRIGIYNRDITLGVNDTLKEKMNFRVTKFDTIPPVLQKGVMTDQNHIVLSFNEDLDVGTLKQSGISIADSNGNSVFEPMYLYQPGGKSSELAVAVKGSARQGDPLRFSISGVQDKAGNTSGTLTTEFPATDKKDTVPVAITGIDPSDMNNIRGNSPLFKVRFDDAVDPELAVKALTVTDTSGRSIPVRVARIDDAFYSLQVDKTLPSGSENQINLQTAGLEDAAGNSRDTTIVNRFTVYNSVNYTGLSGQIEGISNKYVLELYDQDKPERYYRIKADSSGKFEFNDILPGRYRLWIFEDLQGDKEYFQGSLFPFRHSAKFFVYPLTIELITRWITFDFKWSVN